MKSKNDAQDGRAVNAPDENTSLNADSEKQGGDVKEIPWRVIVPIVLIGAVILLFGLPIGAVWIVSSSGCCLTTGTENLITFWASMIAGSLALFGMLITGVFVLTAFRVNAQAETEAQRAAHPVAKETAQATARTVAQEAAQTVAQEKAESVARTEAQTFVQRHKGKLFEEMNQAAANVEALADDAKSDLEQASADIERLRQEAKDATTQVTTTRNETIAAIQDHKGESLRKIDGAEAGVQEHAKQATTDIAQVLESLRNEATEATGNIKTMHDQTIAAANAMRQEVKEKRDEAMESIARAQTEAQRRAAPPAGGPREGEGEPE